MKKYNIIIAHPERLVGQGLSALIANLGAVVQLSDMRSMQACLFNRAPFAITQGFDQHCDWLLLVDLGGLLSESAPEIDLFDEHPGESRRPMGLGLYRLTSMQVRRGYLTVSEFKWLGDIAYSLASGDFLAVVQSYLSQGSQGTNPIKTADELGVIFSTNQEVAESYEASATKYRVGVQ